MADKMAIDSLMALSWIGLVLRTVDEREFRRVDLATVSHF
jgi:hypothetical protein